MTLRDIKNIDIDNKEAYLCWGLYLLCRYIMDYDGEGLPYIIPDSVNIELIESNFGQDVKISVSDDGTELPEYMPPEYDTYDKYAALFSAGTTVYEAVTGMTVYEAENKDISMLPILETELDREFFISPTDNRCGVLAKALAILTAWQPDKRAQGIGLTETAINYNHNCEIEISFLKNGEAIDTAVELLENIGDRVDLTELIPDGEIAEGEAGIVEYRPWNLNVKVNLVSGETIAIAPASGNEIGILVCESGSSVPELFKSLGTTDMDTVSAEIPWTLFGGYDNEAVIYLRVGGHNEAVTSYDYPEYFTELGIISLPDVDEDTECVLKIGFDRITGNQYKVGCAIDVFEDFYGTANVDCME